MAFAVINPFFQFFDNTGEPLASGTVETYESGTSTPKVTYQDATLSTPNSTTITLNSAGRCAMFVGDGETFKYILKDSSGVTIDTKDGVKSPLGTLRYARTDVEIAAGVTPDDYEFEPLDPRRYATVADWSAVFALIDSLAKTYPGWYRGDRAQHPSLTNAIIGYQAYNDSLQSGTVGYRCTAFGVFSQKANNESVSAGGSNTSVGYSTLRLNEEGSGNTCVGGFALDVLTGIDSSHNNAFGYRTFPSLTAGTQNNGFGFQVGDQLIIGDNNHAFGENAMSHLLSGSGNHLYGFQAGYTKVGGNHSHGWGYQALFSENASNITAITKASSAVITVSTVLAVNPFSVGQPVCIRGVSGMTEINDLEGFVSAVGGSSGAWTITVGINSSAFSTYTSGGYLAPVGNVVFGHRVGFNILSRGGNTIMGYDACQGAEPGYGNTVTGFEAGNVINANAGGDGGALNSIYGFWAGLAITSGASNCLFGQRAGINISTGSETVGIGPNSANGVSTAARGVFVGSTTGVNLNGANNTAVGYNAGSQASAQTYTNTGSFGANATPTGSNQITLGDSNIATLRCQQTSITALSDRRFKENIWPLNIPDEALDEIEIVVFDWIGGAKGQVGVIAQQLDEWQEKWSLQWLGLVDKSNPDRWEATPMKLFFPLFQRVQKLTRRVAALEAVRAAERDLLSSQISR